MGAGSWLKRWIPPFLFDTSAESWLASHADESRVQQWIAVYVARHEVQVSAITVLKRVRGYARLGRAREQEAYLRAVGRIWPVDGAVAVASAQIFALVPEPPSPPKRSHGLTESRSGRMGRWRFDVMIAATALITGMRLLHDNAIDFEAVRGAVEREPGRFPGIGSLELIRVARVLD